MGTVLLKPTEGARQTFVAGRNTLGGPVCSNILGLGVEGSCESIRTFTENNQLPAGEISAVAAADASIIWVVDGDLYGSGHAYPIEDASSDERWGTLPGYADQISKLPFQLDMATYLGQTVFDQIVAGDTWYAALTSVGRVVTWGYSDRGAVGQGPHSVDTVPLGKTPLELVIISSPVVSLSAQGDSIFALDNNNELWAWGDNTFGQLGVSPSTATFFDEPMKPDNLTLVGTFGVPLQVAVSDHTALLGTAGDVLTFGNPAQGRLGVASEDLPLSPETPVSPRVVPPSGSSLFSQVDSVCVGSSHTLAILKNDNTRRLYGWGSQEFAQLGGGGAGSPAQIPALIDAFADIEIATMKCGYDTTLVLTDDGRLFSMGGNTFGQLGTGLASAVGVVRQITPLADTLSDEFPINVIDPTTFDAAISPGHIVILADPGVPGNNLAFWILVGGISLLGAVALGLFAYVYVFGVKDDKAFKADEEADAILAADEKSRASLTPTLTTGVSERHTHRLSQVAGMSGDQLRKIEDDPKVIILETLLTQSPGFHDAIEEVLGADKIPEYAGIAVRVLEANGEIVNYSARSVREHVENADEGQIFATGTFAPNLVNQYMDVIGNQYMMDVLVPIVEELATKAGMELDKDDLAIGDELVAAIAATAQEPKSTRRDSNASGSSKISGSSKVSGGSGKSGEGKSGEGNGDGAPAAPPPPEDADPVARANKPFTDDELLQMVKKAVREIAGTIVPAKLRAVLAQVNKAVSARLGEEVGVYWVRIFFLNNFLVPPLRHPFTFGLMDEEPSPKLKSVLDALAATLKVAATGDSIASNRSDFVVEDAQDMTKGDILAFLKSLIPEVPDAELAGLEREVTSEAKIAALLELADICKEKYEPIRTKLKEYDPEAEKEFANIKSSRISSVFTGNARRRSAQSMSSRLSNVSRKSKSSVSDARDATTLQIEEHKRRLSGGSLIGGLIPIDAGDKSETGTGRIARAPSTASKSTANKSKAAKARETKKANKEKEIEAAETALARERARQRRKEEKEREREKRAKELKEKEIAAKKRVSKHRPSAAALAVARAKAAARDRARKEARDKKDAKKDAGKSKSTSKPSTKDLGTYNALGGASSGYKSNSKTAPSSSRNRKNSTKGATRGQSPAKHARRSGGDRGGSHKHRHDKSKADKDRSKTTDKDKSKSQSKSRPSGGAKGRKSGGEKPRSRSGSKQVVSKSGGGGHTHGKSRKSGGTRKK